MNQWNREQDNQGHFRRQAGAQDAIGVDPGNKVGDELKEEQEKNRVGDCGR